APEAVTSLYARVVNSAAHAAPRPEPALARWIHFALPDVTLARWQDAGLHDVGRRGRLADRPRPGSRVESRLERHDQGDAFLRFCLDEGLEGLLLFPISGTARRQGPRSGAIRAGAVLSSPRHRTSRGS